MKLETTTDLDSPFIDLSSDPILISEHHSAEIEFQVDVSSEAQAGHGFYYGIDTSTIVAEGASFNQDVEITVASTILVGPQHTILASEVELGTLKVTTSPASPQAQTLYPGDQDKSVAILRFQALDSDISLKGFSITPGYTYGGQVDSDNVKIYIDGQFKKQVQDTVWPFFDFSSNPIHVNKDSYVDVEVRVDVSEDAVPGHVVKYGITNNYQLTAYSTNNGEAAIIDAVQHTWGAEHTIAAAPVIEGRLHMGLASANPAAQTVYAGQTFVPIILDATARNEAVRLTEIKFNYSGSLESQYVTLGQLYKNSTGEIYKLSSARLVNNQFIFSDFIQDPIIQEDETIDLVLEVMTSSSAPDGKNFRFQHYGGDAKAVGVTSGADVPFSSTYSLNGNLMTIQREQGNLTFSLSSSSPQGTVIAGNKNKEIIRVDIEAGDYEDAKLTKITFDKQGINLENYKLYTINGQFLDDAYLGYGNIYFSDVNLVIPKGETKTIKVMADILLNETDSSVRLEMPSGAYAEAQGMSTSIYLGQKHGFPVVGHTLTYE